MAAEPKRTAVDDLLLPAEIWDEILTRLPVNSILRCRSVCKSWYSLVSCPNFISYYTTRNLNKNRNRLLLKLKDDVACVFSFTSYDESFVEAREHNDFPEAFLDSQAKVVGSCNGLICLSKYEGVDDVEVIKFLIWNPTIRKVVELPSRSLCSRDRHFFYYGFGFDFKTGDYKVMCTHMGRKNYDVDTNVCEIYDLSKGVWRGISPLMRAWRVWGRAPECYLNGAVHWTGFGDSDDGILLSFNMSDEIFRETRIPDDDDREIATLTAPFSGLIHVITWKWGYNAVDVNVGCSVWVMKEYGVAESWTKLFNIDLRSAGVYHRVKPTKFLLWENDEVLMVHDLSMNVYSDDGYDWNKNMESWERHELLLYNTESKECRELISFTKRISIVCLYEESLILM